MFGKNAVVSLERSEKISQRDRNKTRNPNSSMEKRLLDRLFSLVENGSFSVKYWDGTEERYGEEQPLFSLTFKDQSIVGKLVGNPALVFGEAYVDGKIDIEGEIEEIIRLMNMNKALIKRFTGGKAGQKLFTALHRNSPKQQMKDVSHHYDLGNDFFALWLDPTMSYSCAYFRSPENTLAEAQKQKINHTLKKLQLKPGETFLDIGSGWGWLMIQAARKYGVQATGITLSQEQFESTKRRIEELRLGNVVEVLLMDYRELAETGRKFDKVVSVGMLEHVGLAALPTYMEAVRNMLQPRGLMLLHSITHVTEGPPNPWIMKYIFPGGYIPSLREVIWQLPEHDLNLLDVECLRMHYAMTLDRWAEAFEKHVDLIKKKYGESFVRMWRFYLRSCAATFRYSGLSIHQLLFSRELNNDLPLTREYLYV